MTNILLLVVISIACFAIVRLINNLFFHPLARFPGPTLSAISNFSYCKWFLGGRQPYRVLDLHRKYGPIVRVAPNDLSFNTAESWQDIYTSHPGQHAFKKSPFYDGGSFADRCGSIVSERDPARHGHMRKDLAPAFSQKPLSEQESLVADSINAFVERMKRSAGKRVDLSEWFNILTFDIIGDLAFGESFGGIKSETLHPWIVRITGAMTKGALADCFQRFPWLGQIVLVILSKSIKRIIADTKINEQYSLDLIRRRRHRDPNEKLSTISANDRHDFMTNILAHHPKPDHDSDDNDTAVSDTQLAAHASDFVTAGSETTANALSCIIYYLCRCPQQMQTLTTEIRGAFAAYEDINAAATAELEYLQAVILEGLRIYPPLPFALPRVVPMGGAVVDGWFVPGGTVVSTNPVAASLDTANFHSPMEFKPSRWLHNNSEDRKHAGDNLEASRPFSLGPRGCLGQNLAWMEMRRTLASLLFTFDIELVDKDLDWQGQSRMHTLWRKPPLGVRLIVR